MFTGSNNYSLSDIAAASRDDSWGGGGCWIWILLIFILFGWGGYGNGMFDGRNATSSGITDGYILTSDFANIERKIDSVNNGIASLGYDQLSQMNSINQNVSNTGNSIINTLTQQNITNMQNTNAIGGQITALANQLQSCCCSMTNGINTQFGDLKYDLATQSCQTRQAIADSTAAITANADANTRAILDFMTQDKIASLTAENASLKAAANNAAQTCDIVSQLRTPSPIPAYVVQNPYSSTTVCGCNCGC